MPPQGLPKANSKSFPGPICISGINSLNSFIRPISGISKCPLMPLMPRSSAMSVAFRTSVPRRYSTCTVARGWSLRARSISSMPGPEFSASSDSAPPRAVPLKRVITSPPLRPACSAGPPGVIPSTRAPTLSPAALARVSTITPMRPRLSPNAYIPNGPSRVSTRTRGRVLRRRGVPCPLDAAGNSRQAASAATVQLRIIQFSSGPLEPDVTSARRAGGHQLPHQSDALLPKFYELGVLCARFALRECAIEHRNAVFQIRHQSRRVTAQHAAVDVVVLQRIFERCRLLLRLAQLGVELALFPRRRP